MTHWDSGWDWSEWLLMGLMMALFWGAVIALIVMLAGKLGGSAPPSVFSSAEDVLAERFARGDIDASEYGDRLSVLQDQASGGTRRLTKRGATP